MPIQTVTLTGGETNIKEGVIDSVVLHFTDESGAELQLRCPTTTAMAIRALFREIEK